MAKVLNKKTDVIPLDAVYVGRPSKWGNPFRIGKDGNRQAVIAQYEICLKGGTWNHLLDLNELRGKDLVCWCSPLPCHADVLLREANNDS